MTIEEANIQLTTNLKALIIKEKHKATGKLYNTLSVRLVDTGEKLTLSINAQEYLKYLDEGKFLELYTKNPTTKKIIGLYVKSKMIKEFKDSKISS